MKNLKISNNSDSFCNRKKHKKIKTFYAYSDENLQRKNAFFIIIKMICNKDQQT